VKIIRAWLDRFARWRRYRNMPTIVNEAVFWCMKHGRLHYRREYLGADLEWMREHCPRDVDCREEG
jgi:hypothetical protein